MTESMPAVSAVLPPPVWFDLDVAEGARLRDAYIVANGGRLPLVVVLVPAVFQLLLPVLRLYRYHGRDPFDWALLALVVVMIASAISAIVSPRRWQRLFVRPQVDTVVSFDDVGITVERGAPRRRRTKRIALARIRTVRRTSEALFIFGRLQPLVTIPLRAVADDGAQIMSYFEQRIVATRMLRRSSFRTTIVNTASP